MVKTQAPPFRADHVGSLLRPPELLQAREDEKQGRISKADLHRVEDAAIRDVVKRQEDLGLEGVTDGEFRRASWHMDFLYQVGGVAKVPGSKSVQFRNEQGVIEFTPAAHQITSKLHLDQCIFRDDFAFLKSVATATPKLTIPSPSMMHYRSGRAGLDPAIYPDVDEFWHDLAQVYAQEITELAKLGCTYLQLDDISLAYLNDPAQRETVNKLGEDGEHAHIRHIQVINAALANKPAGMSICTHLCRGNFRSSWAASGGYDHVAEALFGELKVDGYFLEYDDARSGTFAPLRFVPQGKKIVLGLVTTKKGDLEKKDDLKRRIDEAAQYVPLDQLCLSPQCGFSSTFEGNALTMDQQFQKLRLIVETAREIWPD
ncbi:MAG TPA: 5-methyltetrahydropteroyltriglutamate--homocysteine S-methyltransferase [Bryobacteraceae bacterium]|nr:5-methyltetrahydropteroyltriglutamate--homocysteine S-methyltransferase [Bryobacteraceae bacterium]HUO32130.1 5-methyltetrahydropteroyltriglutamate--homocysteine S-methyltransferase [Bryobacteraceae bacterium]